MKKMTMSRRIAAPRPAVFAACTDFPNAAERVEGITNVKMLTDGPVGKGTRFEETRTMFGKDATETLEVSAFDPDRSVTVSCFSCGVEYDSTFTFSDDGGGTRVDLEIVTTPKTIGAKIFSPIMGAMMGKMMKKCIEQDLDDLQKHCETDAAG
ncbi:MAG: SRPBCC family protein [Planctomycetota bacterium JB042]